METIEKKKGTHSKEKYQTFWKERDIWRESASVVTVSGSSFPLSASNQTADVITSAVDMRTVTSRFRSPAMITSASENDDQLYPYME